MARRLIISLCLIALLGGLSLALAQDPLDCSVSSCVYVPMVTQPGFVTLRGLRPYVSGLEYTMHGEVYNGLDVPIYIDNVRINFYDASNKEIGMGLQSTWLHMLRPGDVVPFSVPWNDYYALGDQMTHYDGYPVYTTKTPKDIYFFYVQLVRSTVLTTIDYYETTVRARNTFNFTIDGIEYAYTFYDRSGSVLDAGRVYQEVKLAPGQESDYTIRVMYADTDMMPGAMMGNIRAQGTMPYLYLTATPTPMQ